MIRRSLAAAVLIGVPVCVHAAGPATLSVQAAWAPPAVQGEDTKLFMTVENVGAADAIIRVRCAAANFTELRQVDHGEGFPSSRAVKAIPLAATGTTRLGPDESHVALLQLTRALVEGETFDCALRLRDGGSRDVTVAVRSTGSE